MSKIPAHPFVLIDGSSYLYRAFHALPPLTNSKGEATGAVYGFINMLKKLLKDYDPSYVAVVFDAKGKTFRDDLYKEYKANRAPMPDDLVSQIKPIHAIVKAMGIPLIEIQGVEADDVIATLAQQAAKNKMHTLVSTGDKDLAQIVNNKITLINTMSNTLLDPEGVEKKFGIPPELIIDYLTLMGDSVDNIPGIPKVGPKTAAKWLKEYGSLDNVIANADKFTGKIGQYLRDSLDQLPLSKQLVTIKYDVKLDLKPKDLSFSEKDNEKLEELFKHLEFKSWLSDLLGNKTSKTIEKNYTTITDEKTFEAWLKKLEKAKLFAFDTETTSLNYIDAEVVGISFSITPNEAAYVPFAHDYPDAPKQLSRDFVLDKLRPLLENPKPTKIGHNLKYDMSVLANHNIDLKGIAFDTMLESYILQSTGVNHKMDSLSLKYLGYKTISFEEVAGKGKNQITFDKVPLEIAGPYAAEDADITLQLHETLWPKLSKEKKLTKLFLEIELPLVPILSKMERHGVLVDGESLKKQSKQLAKRIEIIEKETFKLAGKEFNLGSPKQLQEILFEELELPIIQKTPKGQPSTAENVLQELALDYELPEKILEYRSLSKLKSTYTDKLPLQINSKTGRVHTSFHQAGTSTGRLSSSDPNLQNIPIKTEDGRKIRQAFIAPKGYKLVSLDYSQIELRIMAHMSGDKNLQKAFANGWDIHSATAAEIFGIPIDKVDNAQRRNAKAINFGLIYGMSAFGLAKQIGTDRTSAQKYIDIYFERYPGVKKYMESRKEFAKKNGYVETIYGRRLYLPEIHAQNTMRRRAAERVAINAPMQGSSADIIKRAMIAIDAWLVSSGVDAKMILQVHDELVFEIAEKDVDKASKKIKSLMEDAAELSVKVLTDVGIGNNWDEAH